MSVRTDSSRDSHGAAKLLGATVGVRHRASIHDLDDVDRARHPLNGLLAQIPSARVVRMFEVDETALLLDGGDRFLGGQAFWHGVLQEQSDQLALAGEDLLSDDCGLPGFNQRAGTVYRVVIGQEDRREANPTAALCHVQGRYPAVERRRAMQVEVDPDQRGPCASGHVGYYRPGEGSGKVRTIEGWLLTGE